MEEQSTPTDAGETPAATFQRSARWRRQLLAKLFKLGYERREPKEAFLLDEQWTNQERLRADAFLRMFESLADQRDR